MKCKKCKKILKGIEKKEGICLKCELRFVKCSSHNCNNIIDTAKEGLLQINEEAYCVECFVNASGGHSEL